MRADGRGALGVVNGGLEKSTCEMDLPDIVIILDECVLWRHGGCGNYRRYKIRNEDAKKNQVLRFEGDGGGCGKKVGVYFAVGRAERKLLKGEYVRLRF